MLTLVIRLTDGLLFIGQLIGVTGILSNTFFYRLSNQNYQEFSKKVNAEI